MKMRDDPKADKLHAKTQEYEYSDPLKAIQLLKEIVRDYKDSYTVSNYVISDILRISISNQYWDEAIGICMIAQELYPDMKKWYAMEIKACQLEQKNKFIEAIEVRFEQDSMRGKYSYFNRVYGDKLLKLGAHDKAWKLYNDGIILASKERISSHQIRQSMAKLLFKEKKIHTSN
jgi:hypothetical protein